MHGPAYVIDMSLLIDRRALIGCSAAAGLAAASGSMAAAAAARPFALVIVGDSIAAGLGLPRQQAFPARLEARLNSGGNRVRVINAGVSGDTIAAARARFGFALGRDAQGVLLALGGNDMLQGADPGQARVHLDAMIRAAKARGLKVALSGMRAPANWGADWRRRFDAIWPDLARQHRIALDPFLLEGVALDRRYNQPDGIHPNAAGADRIAARLAPFVTRAFGPFRN